MVYESWREQVEDGEQKAQQPEIGNVFLIDRGLLIYQRFLQRFHTNKACSVLCLIQNVTIVI